MARRRRRVVLFLKPETTTMTIFARALRLLFKNAGAHYNNFISPRFECFDLVSGTGPTLSVSAVNERVRLPIHTCLPV